MLLGYLEDDEMCGTCGMRGGEGVLLGKPEGRRLLGRPRRRCKEYIKIDVKEAERKGCGLDPYGLG